METQNQSLAVNAAAAPASPAPVALPQPPEGAQPEEAAELTAEQKRALIGAIIFFIVLLVIIGLSVYGLMSSSPEKVAQIRDVFIIFMAMMSLLTSVALVILMIQLARLINLLQNEIRPILTSTNDTVNHLRGTTVFLSDNLVEPVIKLNEYMAGLTQFIATIGLFRRGSKKNSRQGE